MNGRGFGRALCLSALALAPFWVGCAAKIEAPRSASGMLDDAIEPGLDLDVCLFIDPGRPEHEQRFKNGRAGKGYFRSVKRIGSLNDTVGCDLVVALKCHGIYASSALTSEVYSAYSKKKVLLLAEKCGEGVGRAGAEIYQAYRPGTPLYSQLVAERRQAPSPSAWASPAPAAPTAPSMERPVARLPERPDDFALIVGVERYSNDLPDARFAEHDARAMRELLLALGYPERNIKSLTGDRASHSALAAYLEDWLPRNVKENSRVFFYFSGHGAPDPGSSQAYLVPWDGNPNFLAKTAYPVKKLYAQLNALKAKQVIVALDACFSGAGGRSVLAEGSRPLVTRVDASVSSGGKIVLFAAASANEITSTLREQEHGIFTYYFLSGLGGAAQNAAGVVTARGLYGYLKPKVQDAASRQNRDQTPVLEGAVQGDLVRFRD